MIEYPIILFWSDEDEAYIADVPDLGGFSAWGPTPEAALREIRLALSSLMTAAEEQGLPLPPPTSRPTLAKAS